MPPQGSQPPTRGYRYQQDGRQESDGYMGNYLMDRTKVDLWKLAWKSARVINPYTTVRLLPGLIPGANPDEWCLTEWRNSFEPCDYGDWLRAYTLMRIGGDSPAAFFTHDPLALEAGREYDRAASPVWTLYNGLWTAKRQSQDRPGWSGLLDGGAGKGAVVPKPKKSNFARAILFEHGGKVFEEPRGFTKPLIMELGGAGDLISQMEALRPDYDTEATDYASVYQLGRDPIGLGEGNGLFWRFFPKGCDPRVTQQAPAAQQKQSLAERAASARASGGGVGVRGQQEKEEIGFGCYFMEEFNATTPEIPLDAVAEKLLPWEDFLVFHDEMEQAKLIASRLPFDVLEYVWRDHPEWLPERSSDIAQQARGAVSVPVGAVGGVSRQALLGRPAVPVGQPALAPVTVSAIATVAPAVPAASPVVRPRPRPAAPVAANGPGPVQDIMPAAPPEGAFDATPTRVGTGALARLAAARRKLS